MNNDINKYVSFATEFETQLAQTYVFSTKVPVFSSQSLTLFLICEDMNAYQAF